jgi:hypothetical protein
VRTAQISPPVSQGRSRRKENTAFLNGLGAV